MARVFSSCTARARAGARAHEPRGFLLGKSEPRGFSYRCARALPEAKTGFRAAFEKLWLHLSPFTFRSQTAPAPLAMFVERVADRFLSVSNSAEFSSSRVRRAQAHSCPNQMTRILLREKSPVDALRRNARERGRRSRCRNQLQGLLLRRARWREQRRCH